MPHEIFDERLWKSIAMPHRWFVVPCDDVPHVGEQIEIVRCKGEISTQALPFFDLFGGESRVSHASSGNGRDRGQEMDDVTLNGLRPFFVFVVVERAIPAKFNCNRDVSNRHGEQQH